MTTTFYGYTVRATTDADLALAVEWSAQALDARFWIDSTRRQNFLVSKDGEPIAFFQRERVNATQVRLHFQASPVASRKKILRGITMLVPLIEKGLASGGVKHIFFTSHSLAMIAFMEKRMGYRLARNTDGGVDGAVMFKQLDAVKVEFHVTALPATLPPHCGSVLRVVADAPSSAGAAPQEPKSGVAEQTAERGAK